MSFVERALPLPTSSISSSHSYSRNGGHVLETPPDRPVWETRQPLKGVSHEGRYPSYDTSMDQEQHNILGITMTINQYQISPPGGLSGFQVKGMIEEFWGFEIFNSRIFLFIQNNDLKFVVVLAYPGCIVLRNSQFLMFCFFFYVISFNAFWKESPYKTPSSTWAVKGLIPVAAIRIISSQFLQKQGEKQNQKNIVTVQLIEIFVTALKFPSKK